MAPSPKMTSSSDPSAGDEMLTGPVVPLPVGAPGQLCWRPVFQFQTSSADVVAPFFAISASTANRFPERPATAYENTSPRLRCRLGWASTVFIRASRVVALGWRRSASMARSVASVRLVVRRLCDSLTSSRCSAASVAARASFRCTMAKRLMITEMTRSSARVATPPRARRRARRCWRMSSPSSSSLATPCIGAARSATAERNRVLRRSRSVAVRAQRRSRLRGSLRKTPWSAGGTAVDPVRRSPPTASHSQVPSVTTARMRSADFVANQRETSLFTHSDRAASGEASRTNHSLSAIARSMDSHRSGFVDSPDSSRKMCSARRLFHGFARRCRPCWRAGASRASDAWL